MTPKNTCLIFRRAINIIIIGSLFILSACNDYSAPDLESNRISGNATKGVIENGIIQAFDISSEPKIFLGETRTNADGNFTLELPQYAQDAVIILELTTDDISTMRCDLLPSCIESSSGKLVAFGNLLKLPSHFKLLGTLSAKTKLIFLP